MIAVVDSSVAVKWYVAEPDSELAADLLRRELVAPDLIRAEVANALWKKVRKQQIGSDQAGLAMPHLAAAVALVPSPPLADDALKAALDLGHPVYDCFFLILAERLELPLVTADTRLRQRAMGSRFEGRVRALADWAPE